MKEHKINYRLLNVLIIITIVFLLYQISGLWLGIVENIFNVISPFVLAFAIAYVVYPIVKKLVDAGSPKWLAILAVCILGLGIVLILLLLTVPLLYEQILLFISNLSVLLSDIGSKFSINFGPLQSNLADFSSNVIKNIGSFISDGAVSIFSASVSALTGGVVVLCAAVYFLIDMKSIRGSINNYFNKHNEYFGNYLKILDTQLTKYIGGLGLSILLQIIEYTIAFLIIGHPNYLILGILSGISAIIPWFGGFIVAIISLLVSSVISSKLFLSTVVICLICPIIDGNVIGPKVYGKTNKLHPLTVIFAVSAGGMIAGFWGIVISLPVAIAIITTYKYFKTDVEKKIKTIRK